MTVQLQQGVQLSNKITLHPSQGSLGFQMQFIITAVKLHYGLPQHNAIMSPKYTEFFSIKQHPKAKATDPDPLLPTATRSCDEC
jgi:hypothetical protein